MELVARVKSQLRRYTQFGNANESSEEGIYRVCGLTVDDNSKKVTVDGRSVTLTATEFGILKLLAQSPDRVFSMEQIYESVWDEPAYNPENTVAVHIRHIREKIEINPKDPRYIKVVWGTGYKLEGDN
jgi:DNA-binding response OmpR family regulator